MKEFKFRLWCPGGKKFYYNPIIQDGKPFCWNYEETELVPWYSKEQELLYGEPILTQFIGLKDSKEKEIYEGDIVESHYECEVKYGEFEPYNFIDVITYQETEFHCEKADFPIELYQLKIIGNIFENGDLLK